MMRRVVLLFAVLALSVGADPARGAKVVGIEVDGAIFHPVVEYLSIAIEQAERDGADAILFELDTPGGSLEATKKIVQQILGSPVPVVVYVTPSGAGAISAGTFITLSAHVAAMAPGTTIGAAHPVQLGGGSDDERQSEIMEKKTENYAISFIEAIASQRGRNVEWAAEAVRESSAITASEALEKKVVDLVAPTREALLAEIDGRTVVVQGEERILATKGAAIVEVEMSVEQRFYFFLANPTMIFILLILGLGGLYLEFQAPGMIVPGVVGAIALLLALIGFSIVPVNYAGVALFVLGMLLLGAELFVPSFGALGVGGIVCLVLGSLLLFQTAEAPGIEVNRALVAATAVGFGGFILVAGTLVLRSHRSRVTAGQEAMIGEVGVARTAVAPRGKVFVVGEIWDAVVDGDAVISEGDEVEVVGIEGLKVSVVPKRRV